MGQALNFLTKDKKDAPHLARLDDVLARYHHYYKNEIEPGTARIVHVLGLLGNPQDKMPPAIHIAGTNGKGSSLAFLQALLEGEGQRIHKMSSPHLISLHERFYVAGKFIETLDLIDLLEGLEPLYEENEISFFEAITAATFKLFCEHDADFSLIETGMGGRFDATNVLNAPALTMITTISHDHEGFLGSDISQIAGEKAGIMKTGVPCIIGPQIFPEVYDVFRQEAQEKQTPLYCAGKDWFIENDQNGKACLLLEKKYGWPIEDSVYILPELPLLGQHQYGNAAMALIAAKIILAQKRQEAVGVADLLRHLSKTKWPARLQNLAAHSYQALLPPQAELWLDGAHNDSAAIALAAQIRCWKNAEDCTVYLVVGMIKAKTPEAFFAPLRPVIDGITTVTVPTSWKSYTPQDLLAQASLESDKACQSLGAYESVEQALAFIADQHKARDVQNAKKKIHVIICGSLYLAGSVLGVDENAENHFN
jgi:dihydrofolate synthase/folylpolyglutamate synthase